MFGRTVNGFGSYASRGEPDVSNVLIEDENGNDNSYTKVENSMVLMLPHIIMLLLILLN